MLKGAERVLRRREAEIEGRPLGLQSLQDSGFQLHRFMCSTWGFWLVGFREQVVGVQG